MKNLKSEEFRNNPLFLRNQFRSDGVFEMPIIRRQDIDLKNIKLIGYDQTKPNDKVNAQSFVHFFLDDYKFEVIWNDPEPRLPKLSQYKGILSPQFSTYYTMPVSVQIHNTFRSRWCGAYLQSKGLTVIPTVYWGKPQSYWYCFDGIEKGSIVALSTLGVKKEKGFFLQGYNEMLRRIDPKAIICYSEPFPEMKGNVITIDYAQTNNLANRKTFYGYVDTRFYKAGTAQLPEAPQDVKSCCVVKSNGYVITDGFGGGGSGKTNASGVKVNVGHQDKHIPGTNNYKQEVENGRNKSILTDDPQRLLDNYAGTGEKIGTNKERVNFGKVIGQYYDETTGQYVDTMNGIIHYDGRGGAHIVPARP